MQHEQSAKTVAFWLLERCNELRRDRDAAVEQLKAEQRRVMMLERDTQALISRLEELEYAANVVQVQYVPDYTPPAIAPVGPRDL